MIAYLGLSLRRERTLALGLSAAFAVTLPLAVVGARAHGSAAQQGLDAALLFWAIVGLPLSALILGSSVASSMRSQPVLEAEAPLPISPRRRALAGALTALVYWIVLALLVAAAARLFGIKLRTLELEGPLEDTVIGAALWLCAGLSCQVLLTSFAASYAVGHAVAGGLVAAALSAVPTMALGSALAMSFIHGGRVPVGSSLAAAAVASLGAGLYALRQAAWHADRRTMGLKAVARVAAALVLGPAAAFVCGASYVDRTARRLEFCSLWDYGGVYEPAGRPSKPMPAQEGAFLSSLTGALVWVEPSGRVVTLLPADRRGLKDMLERQFGAFHTIYRLRDGAVVVSRGDEDGRGEILAGPLDRPLSRVYAGSEIALVNVAERGGRVELASWDRAAVLEPGKPLQWRVLKKSFGFDFSLKKRREEDLAAGTGGWRRGAGYADLEFYDATSKRVVRRMRMRERDLALDRGRGRLPAPVRYDGRHVWLIAGRRVLIEADVRSGAVVASWPLPDGDIADRRRLTPFQTVKDGIFARTRSGLLFVGWDGSRREIRLPEAARPL